MRVLAGVLLAAFNLRVAIASLGPLIDEIRDDTGLSSALAGILTAIPFICLALFMVLGAALVRRIGFARLLWLSLATVAVGTVVRALPGSPALLLAGTVPIGIGIAFSGALLPGIVKRHFSTRAGAATGAYVASQSLGGAIAALTVVPLAAALGGWEPALALTAVPAFVALALWPVAGIRASDMAAELPVKHPRRPSRAAVVLGVAFGGQAMCFSAAMAWVAAVYIDGGWTEGEAAWATAVILLITIPMGLIAMPLSDGRDRRRWIAVSAALITVGFIGMAFALDAAGWLWLILAAAGMSATFPLILALPVDVGRSAYEVTDLSSWMQGIGYAMAAVAPIAIGALRDATGGFDVALVALAVVASGVAALAVFALPGPPGPASSPRARAAAR